jgi:hypothetical protein
MDLNDVRPLPMTAAQFRNGEVVTYAVQNYHEYHMRDIEMYGRMRALPRAESRALFDRQHLIVGDNRKRFREMFGKPHFHFRGEFYMHAWRLDIGAAQVVVLTGKGKGTCYEVVTQVGGREVKADIHKVLEFIDDICGGTPERKAEPERPAHTREM